VFDGVRGQQSTKDGIWAMDRDGSHLRMLVSAANEPGNSSDGDVSVAEPGFSPDGAHIVYDRCVPEGPPQGCDHDVVVMRRSGRHKHVVRHGSQAVFSPDGGRIAFIRKTLCGSDPDGNEIFTTARDGTDPRRVTHVPYCFGGGAYDPSWQPIPAP
jgi:hypothetical protein